MALSQARMDTIVTRKWAQYHYSSMSFVAGEGYQFSRNVQRFAQNGSIGRNYGACDEVTRQEAGRQGGEFVVEAGDHHRLAGHQSRIADVDNRFHIIRPQ